VTSLRDVAPSVGPLGSVQRQVAAPPADPGIGSTPASASPPVRDAPTLGHLDHHSHDHDQHHDDDQQGSASVQRTEPATPLPSFAPAAPSDLGRSGRPESLPVAHSLPAAAPIGRSPGAGQDPLPTLPVQRADVGQAAGPGPEIGQGSPPVEAIDQLRPAAPGTDEPGTDAPAIAPLLGGRPAPLGPLAATTPVAAQPTSSADAPTAARLAPAVQPPAVQPPAVQRSAASTTPTPPTTPTRSAPLVGSAPPHALDAQAVPITPAQPPDDGPVTVREKSLQRMFEPGAAAVASGAAYADGSGSVIFHPPGVSNPILGSSPTLGSSVLASSSSGSPFGTGHSVQRFAGLPSTSSLIGGANSAANSLVGSARHAAGGYADAARGYADTAKNAGAGYLDSARSTAGGYLDSARNAAGGYPEQALNTAGSSLHPVDLGRARGTATDLADTAHSAVGGAVHDATSAAQGAVSSATDSANSAAGGAAAGGHAASATAGAVTGAAGAAAGAAGATGAAAGALPTDLDELARWLIDPISARLKSELWLDRERAGMVTDLRR
ncbi:MAG TPA: hypothetical protein VII33_08945, partial [Nakamurella sp.]